MSHACSPRRRRLLPTLVATTLLLASCSDDGGGQTAGGEKPAPTRETAEPDTGGFAGYDEHRSDLYAGTKNWICHPDLDDDECRDVRTTVIEPDGSRRVDDLERADDPGFDCFYVYPTTSADPEVNSDLDVDDSEVDTVRAQVARYSSVCRVFAPAYRQVTIAGLFQGGLGEDPQQRAYGDVLDAWKTYVNQDNDGRGVVLIGHSQGSGHLRRLLSEELDPEPDLRALLVSAVLLGTTIAEPTNGTTSEEGLRNIAPCTSPGDTGCLVSYSSYPAASPPVEGALFGGVREEGQRAVCVNPVELAGGDGLADPVLLTKPSLVGAVAGFEDVATPFVSLPGALEATCTVTGPYSYLAVEPDDPDDPRPLSGLVKQGLGPTWGLHLLDANLAQDDLIELVTQQAERHR